MSESLFERGKALEDRFFSEKDKELLDRLRQEISDKENFDALSAASGIGDESVLKALIAQNVTAESLTTVSLIPLVAVGWADGVMEDKEREAILQAAGQAGIVPESAAKQLLEGWLSQQPSDDLLSSWKDYVAAIKATLDDTSFNQLKSSIIGRAKSVAEAAGGFLGIGKVSDKETAVLNDLEKSFG